MRPPSTLVALLLAVLALTVSDSARAASPESATGCALPRAEIDSGVHLQGDYDYLKFPRGKAKVLVLQVDFSDAPGTEDARAEVDATRPAGAILRSASFGRFQVEVDGIPKWFRMPKPKADYKGFATTLVTDAIRTADAEVDFSGYDFVLAAVPPGSGQVALAGVLREADAIRADGNAIRFFARIYSGEPTTAAHELSHTFGLTDLYGAEAGDRGRYVGIWDTMSFGRRFGYLAWHKWKLGWLDPGQIDCVTRAGTTEHTLAPAAAGAGTKAVAIRTGPHTVLVAENRQSVATDQGLCTTGILVYSVDATVGHAQGPIRVLPAKPDDNVTGCGRLHNAPFNAGDVASYADPATGVTIEALANGPGGYRVRVTRSDSYSPPAFDAAVQAEFSLSRHLRATAQLWSVAAECMGKVKVRVERRSGKRYRTVATARSRSGGTAKLRLRDRAGDYRANVKGSKTAAVRCAAARTDDVSHRHKRKRSKRR